MACVPALLLALTSAPFSTSMRAFAALPAPECNAVASNFILRIDVGAAFEQQLDCFGAAESGGVHQQGGAALVASVDVGGSGESWLSELSDRCCG